MRNETVERIVNLLFQDVEMTDEVQALYAGDWEIDLRDRRPIPADHPGFVAGVSRLDTAVYALRRR